jgi:glycosyltransferase involved in cell wall biosynthesis
MPDPWDDVARAGEWLLDLADEVRPDVVHVNGFAHAALAWHAPVLVCGHSDVVSWYRAVRGIEPPPEWDRYRAEVARGLAAADLLVAPTRWLLDELVRTYSPGCERAVIPNGRTAPGLPAHGKEPLVFAAGRIWDEAKNVAALGRIAPRLRWPVVVAGDGDVDGARALGRIRADEVAAWLARASVFALPARYEPFGLAALEAALAGCALVLGDIPSLREVWSDAALYVDPEDDDALAAALDRLIRDDELRAELAHRARRRAGCYTPAATAEAYLARYRRLAAARPVEAAV